MLTTRVIKNTPLRPLSSRMRRLTKECLEFWVASAFVTQNAVNDILGEAVAANAKVRFLTGTFGRNTRKSTFQAVLDLQDKKQVEARVWTCGRHENFHAKLYIWKLPGDACVAWIGSANFTDGGLQEEGEMLLEVRAPEKSSTMKKLRGAFASEWKLGRQLTEAFVRDYKEAPHPAPDAHPSKTGRRPPKEVPDRLGRFFTTYVSRHFAEDSRVAQRVADLLPGTVEDWFRSSFKKLRRVRKGDLCLLVDVVIGKFSLVQVTDVVRDGKFGIFAYDSITQQRPWTDKARARLDNLGLRGKGRALGVQWIKPSLAKVVLPEIQAGMSVR